MSSDQRIPNLPPVADRREIDLIHQLQQDVAQVQIGAEHLVGDSEALEHHEERVDDRSQIDCIVGRTQDDNNSASSGWTTMKYRSNSRTGRFIDRVMASANVPGQRSNEQLCGRVAESRTEQTSDNQSISLTGHPADSSIQSGMPDVDQSVQCLGSVYYSSDSVRYFRRDTLTHIDDYLSVYDTNRCEYNDAAHEIIDTLFATRAPPDSNNKYKKIPPDSPRCKSNKEVGTIGKYWS